MMQLHFHVIITLANVWYEVVANGAAATYQEALSVMDFTRYWPSDKIQVFLPVPQLCGLYKNNNTLGAPARLNIPRNIVRNDNYIGHDSWNTGDI